MPLADTLVTNEIKDASGTEIEFSKLDSEGREKIFAKVGESYSLRHRFSISHEETGVGMKRVRRSKAGVIYDSISEVDGETVVTAQAYSVLVLPVAHYTTQTSAKMVMANLNSALASDGTSTTVKYDGTGTFTNAMLNGLS